MAMLLGLSCHAAIILVVVWRAFKSRRHLNWLLVIAGCVLFALGVEIYRELMKLTGVQYHITATRELWYRFVYFSFGFYYNEVFHHVREITRHNA